jgi:hypothetical protein
VLAVWIAILLVGPRLDARRLPARLSNCRGSFDPYRYSAAALRACGYRVIPLVAIKTLPGGGRAYVYADRSAQLVPPPGFKPLKASNAQLSEYGIPTRPSQPAARRLWLQEMSAWKRSVPPAPFLVSDPYAQLGGAVVSLVRTQG